MTEETNGATDEQVRIAMLNTMEQMRQHTIGLTELVDHLNAENRLHCAQIANVAEGTDGLAEVVNQNADVANENQAQADAARQVANTKELITHIFEKSHQYVTVIVGGAFAAYFATLNALASRFSDFELRVSALLMTISLTVFVLWEVTNIFYIGHHTMKGDYGVLTETPRWMRAGWYVALILTLATALPAIGLSVYTYLRGLGVIDWLQHVL